MKLGNTCMLLLAGLISVAACENPTASIGETALHSRADLSLAQADDNQKTALCHRTGQDSYVVIEVAGAAVDAHRRHGDKVIGLEVNAACEPLEVTLDASAPESMVGEAVPSVWGDPETDGRLICDIPVTLTADGNTFARLVLEQFTLYAEDGETVLWASNAGEPWYAQDVYPGAPVNLTLRYFTDGSTPGWEPFVVEQSITYAVGESDQLKTTSFRTACLYEEGA